jgi:ATP-dependent DNA helicase RecG
MVEIYDNRVEITNPGGLISTISVNEFGTRSFSRNPLVFGLFNRMDLVEKIGSGINRMKEAMQAANLPEPVFNLEGIFAITLFRPIEFDLWLKSWEDKLNPSQIKLLELIHSGSKLTILEMASKLNFSKAGIEKNIVKLKELGVLQRIGSDKEGSYTIIYRGKE